MSKHLVKKIIAAGAACIALYSCFSKNNVQKAEDLLGKQFSAPVKGTMKDGVFTLRVDRGDNHYEYFKLCCAQAPVGCEDTYMRAHMETDHGISAAAGSLLASGVSGEKAADAFLMAGLAASTMYVVFPVVTESFSGSDQPKEVREAMARIESALDAYNIR